jgi:hypothetical protein
MSVSKIRAYEQIGRAYRIGAPYKRELEAMLDIGRQTGLRPAFTAYRVG